MDIVPEPQSLRLQVDTLARLNCSASANLNSPLRPGTGGLSSSLQSCVPGKRRQAACTIEERNGPEAPTTCSSDGSEPSWRRRGRQNNRRGRSGRGGCARGIPRAVASLRASKTMNSKFVGVYPYKDTPGS